MTEIDAGLWKEELLSALQSAGRRAKGGPDGEMLSSVLTLAASARCVSAGAVSGEGWDIPSGFAAAREMDYNRPILVFFTMDRQDRAALAVNVSENILGISFTRNDAFIRNSAWFPDPAVLHLFGGELSATPFFASQAGMLDDAWLSHGLSATAVAGRTAGILACGNVHSTVVEPPAPVKRARSLSGMDPKFSYETLGYSAFSENGKRVLVTIDDGRFAIYSEKKPLFGKYAGKFWLPAKQRPADTQSEPEGERHVPGFS